MVGARHLRPDAVVRASGLVGRPTFAASGAEARRAVLGLAAVREARVSIALPDQARVELVEREALGRWALSGVEWYVDAEGVVFQSADPAGAPLLRVTDDRDTTRACAGRAGGRCVDPALVEAALRLARIGPGELRPDALRPETRIDAVLGLVVQSGAGWEIRLGGADRLDEKLALARKFLSDNPTRRLNYLDVRSPDRIVINPPQ